MLLATTALVALLQLQRALRRHARPLVAHAASGWQGHFQHDGPLRGMAHCVFHQIAQRNGQRIKIAPNPDVVAFWQHQLQAVQQWDAATGELYRALVAPTQELARRKRGQ